MGARIHSVVPTWATLFGLLCLFFGERVYGADDAMRPIFAGLAAASVLAALALRFVERGKADAHKRVVQDKLLLFTATVAVSLALYALLAAVFTEDTEAHARFRGVLWALWPTTLAAGLFPLLAIELAVMPVARIPIYEQTRVKKSWQRALALAVFTACLVLANYLGNRHDEQWELSAGLQAVASEQTESAVRDLTKPVKVVLFFPRANDAAERLERYFEPLLASNSNLTVERVDHALAGDLAKDAKVNDNGYVGIFQDKASEKVRVGAGGRASRSALRRFDGNFLKALIKVTTTKKVAYFTSGHGERASKTPDKDDARTPVKLIRKQLEAWQYTVKELSVANGLADEIPGDAGLVLIMGPKKPFLDAEVEALKKATDKGLRLVVALEPGAQAPKLQGLLSALGLEADTTVLANEKAHARVTSSEADRYKIYSNRFSSHASVTTMNRNAPRIAVIFEEAASLAKKDGGALSRTKTQMVIHGVDGTFADLDGDYAFDEGVEKKARYELAAAVTRTSTTGKKDDESRVFVISDVDVFGDKLIKLIEPNIYLFRDVVLWLKKDAEPVAPTISEQDVKIVHRKEEDALVFYGTTFGVPALVILAGWVATRRRRS